MGNAQAYLERQLYRVEQYVNISRKGRGLEAVTLDSWEQVQSRLGEVCTGDATPSQQSMRCLDLIVKSVQNGIQELDFVDFLQLPCEFWEPWMVINAMYGSQLSAEARTVMLLANQIYMHHQDAQNSSAWIDQMRVYFDYLKAM